MTYQKLTSHGDYIPSSPPPAPTLLVMSSKITVAPSASFRPESPNSRSSSSVYSGQAAANASFVIPPALSFENVMAGKTCPPVNEKDFLNFTKFVDHTEENLLFYLWEKDYTKRFREKQDSSDIALAPEWTPEMQEVAIQNAIQATQARIASKKQEIMTGTTEIFKGIDFEKPPRNPFVTPPRTPSESITHSSTAVSTPWESLTRPSTNPSQLSGTTSGSYAKLAAETFNSAGFAAPFTVQPFREEINRIVATYLRDGSLRQLNLSSKERTALLRALEYTTHPSAFTTVKATIESTLRKETHRRFIRHAICNGNEARITFARLLGIATIALSLLAATLLTLSGAPRGYRAIAAVGWLVGTATLYAGMKGMCVVLHGLHHRHLRPWELFDEANAGVAGGEAEMKSSFDSVGSAMSLEDYPWVAKYEKRNLVRKIFDKEVWIQEPAIRQMQDRIFLKSLAVAVGVAVVLSCLFVPLPHGGYF